MPWISAGIITFSSARELGQQVMELEHEADAAIAELGEPRRVHPRQLFAVEEDRAGGRQIERAEDLQQRRLADAGRADDRDHLARGELEIDGGQHLELDAAVLVDLRQVSHDDVRARRAAFAHSLVGRLGRVAHRNL